MVALRSKKLQAEGSKSLSSFARTRLEHFACGLEYCSDRKMTNLDLRCLMLLIIQHVLELLEECFLEKRTNLLARFAVVSSDSCQFCLRSGQNK